MKQAFPKRRSTELAGAVRHGNKANHTRGVRDSERRRDHESDLRADQHQSGERLLMEQDRGSGIIRRVIRSTARWAGMVAAANLAEIGRAHVLTPVTNAHLVCRLLLETKNTLSIYTPTAYQKSHSFIP